MCCVAVVVAAGNDEPPPDNICHPLPSMWVPLLGTGVHQLYHCHHIHRCLPPVAQSSPLTSPTSITADCCLEIGWDHHRHCHWGDWDQIVFIIFAPPSFLPELPPLLPSSPNSHCHIPHCCLCRGLLLLRCHPPPDAIIFHFVTISSSSFSYG